MLHILVIFLLVQALSATNEFPDLMQNIKVSWNEVDLTSQLDARLTSSYDNQVDYFFLCGPFQTNGKDGSCRIDYYYENSANGSYIAATHKGFFENDAHLFASYLGKTTCMRFTNLVPDFLASKQNPWSANYTCETVKASPKPDSRSDSKPMNLYTVGVVIALVLVGFFAFKIGQKKGAESSQGNSSGAYKALGANNKVHGGNPSYGNPLLRLHSFPY